MTQPSSLPGSVSEPEIVLAQPRGFCAGVDRAISIVERALEIHGAPIYVRHEIVHNRYVVDDLKSKGAIFIDELADAPSGAIVIFSAHGVSRAVRAEAERRSQRIFDATCPLVTKVHVEVSRMRKEGLEVIMIGHRGHPEVEGTLGQADNGMYLVETVADVAKLQVRDPRKIGFVTQTTLSIDDAAEVAEALRQRFPGIVEPKKGDICYATQNRQDAVRIMAPQCDLVIVVGSQNSSNSNRLQEVAERKGVKAYLLDRPDMIDPAWLTGAHRIGVTAGASAPEALVQQVIARLKALGARSVRPLAGVKEQVSFPLPRELSRKLGHTVDEP
ncbi:4-hydroxy-3-methylbut-2-enyl diphosphate reductase OS=Castellaniella defragrans OX=75697 GN=ispH PE=3 SV=1 [Castellaniella defragrans]